jgi:hypothetical protein
MNKGADTLEGLIVVSEKVRKEQAIAPQRIKEEATHGLVSQSRAITTVVQALPILGRSRATAILISRQGCSLRMMGQ